jgi:hypothetical protein
MQSAQVKSELAKNLHALYLRRIPTKAAGQPSRER